MRTVALRPRFTPATFLRQALGVLAALTGTTALVAVLERWVGVPDASSTYLLAELATAVSFGVKTLASLMILLKGPLYWLDLSSTNNSYIAL